jgi:thiopeptide-type bacteriocin biosynthesis protein
MRTGPLYAPLDWAMVRAPLLPAGTAPPGADAPLLPADPEVRLALAIASPDLAAAAARTPPDGAKAARVRRSVLRYLIRMSTRPTPYGLFSGVGLAYWSPSTTLAVGNGSPPTRTRPDMGWLTDLVARLEDDAAVRAGLRFAASSAVLVRGGRALLTDGPGTPVSVRATAAVRCVLAAARTPVPLAELTAELHRSLGATEAEAAGVLAELRRAGLLISDLRPALIGGDPAEHVQTVLAGIPAGRGVAGELAELRATLADWDRRPLPDRSPWPVLLERARSVHRPAEPGNVLQTDMALPLAGTGLHTEVGAEAARAAELLLRLGPLPTGRPDLAAYREAFEDRYGSDREVPLLELLDPDFGLGPPPEAEPPPRPTAAQIRRDQRLIRLALEAHRDGRAVVELDDTLLAELDRWTPDPATAPPTVDLPVLVAAGSVTDLDAGRFLLVVGPNVGSVAAGSNLGRFADLLGRPGLDALLTAAAAEAAAAPGPRSRRGGLLAAGAPGGQRRPPATGPAVPADRRRRTPGRRQLGAAGRRRGRHPGRSPHRTLAGRGRRAALLAGPHAEPAGRAARGAVPARHRRRPALPADVVRLGGGRAFPVPAAGPARPDRARPRPLAGRRGARADRRRRRRRGAELAGPLVRTPRRAAHQRRPATAARPGGPGPPELLRHELGRPAGQRPTLVQEALPGRGDAWLPGPDGGRIAELVVPLALRAPAPAPAVSRRARPVPERVRVRLPGSDWLYLKLYVPAALQDQVIAGPLRSFGTFATGAGLSDGWYFLRYGDPRRHLRVRLHGDPAALAGPLLRRRCAGRPAWSRTPVLRRRRRHLPAEVERYGGPEGMAVAEQVAAIDSAAVAELLHTWRDGGTPADRTALAVLGLRDLLDAMDLGPDGSRAVLAGATVVHSGRAGVPAAQGRAAPAARSRRPRRRAGGHRARPPTRRAHPRGRRPPRARRLGPAGPPAYGDRRVLAHLHVNRLIGTDHQDEQRALDLLRRTLDALQHGPAPALGPV